MAPWSHYFQFDTDTRFKVDGPLGYNGLGRVIERTDDVLHVRLDIPAWGPAPEFKGTLYFKYVKEGDGNQVILHLDNQPPLQDDNATMTSDDASQKRSIDGTPITCSVANESDPNEIDFDLVHEGSPRDFDLIRQ